MDLLIEEIFKEVAKKHNLNTVDIERIYNSQFKVFLENIGERSPKSVIMMHLGKFIPTKYLANEYELVQSDKKVKEYSKRLV